MEFHEFDIIIEGETRHFDLEYRELTEYGQACFIRSGGRELIVDEDLAIIRNEFPNSWLPEILGKLQQLLNAGKLPR